MQRQTGYRVINFGANMTYGLVRAFVHAFHMMPKPLFRCETEKKNTVESFIQNGKFGEHFWKRVPPFLANFAFVTLVGGHVRTLHVFRNIAFVAVFLVANIALVLLRQMNSLMMFQRPSQRECSAACFASN